MNQRLKIILTTFLILGSLYFLFIGLTQGKSFLIPLTTAIILSMVMNPVAKRLNKWGLGRGWAIFISDLIIIAFIAFIIFLLVAQANNMVQNWSKIEGNIQPRIEQVERFLNKKLNISSSGNKLPINEKTKQDQPQNESQQNGKTNQEKKQNGSSIGTNNIKDILTGLLKNVFGFLSNMLLILAYIFFFMYYEKKFVDAIIGLVPKDNKDKARSIIHESAKIAQKYLLGRFILIIILAILYMVGFTLSGLEHAIFISLLAALFSLLPYIGNVIALVLALGMSFISDGGTGQIIGIFVAFSIIQFIESYILEPFVVGDKVDLNPVIIIVGVVLGGSVWGVMGMILVIPILGILKVVFDSIDTLRPFGYVLDERGISSDDGTIQKLKRWFQKKLKGK